jgi:hypothetical protein
MSSGLFLRLHCGEALPLFGQLQNGRTLMFVIALKDKRPTLFRPLPIMFRSEHISNYCARRAL